MAKPKTNQVQTTGTKVAVYVRVSTAGQKLEGQREAIQRWLNGHSLTDVLWFEDKFSGETMDRPGFNDLQSAIFHGEVGTVVVFKLDRMSRTMIEGMNVLQKWLDKGIRFVSVTEQFDFHGPTGKLLAAVLLSLAEMEMQNRRERQAEGITVAKTQGKYTGRKPGTFKVDSERVRELRKTLTIQETANALGCSVRTVCKFKKETATV
jgi:DNA invertase Pin-like site-specific DNA recombinase